MVQQNDLYTYCNEIIDAFNEFSSNSYSLFCFLVHFRTLADNDATNDQALHAIHAIINSSFYVNQSVVRLNAAAARLAQLLGTTGHIIFTPFQ